MGIVVIMLCILRCVIVIVHSALSSIMHNNAFVFTARGYAKRGICRRCVSVCVSVSLSHSGIVSKRLNVGSRKQSPMIAP